MEEVALISCDKIISWLQERVEQHIPIDPHTWLSSAQKMNVLLGDEQEMLFGIQQSVAKLKLAVMEAGGTAAKAKVLVEASDAYKDMCIQKAKIDRVIEHIRIAKIQARNAADEARGNF